MWGALILSVSTSKKSFNTNIDAEIANTEKKPDIVMNNDANSPSVNN